MKYDFDAVIERRNTDSAKWSNLKSHFGSDNVLPMWLADMDFSIARPITEALRKRMEHGIYGYTHPRPSLLHAVVHRMQQRYGWKVKAEWIAFTPGVIPAVSAAVRALTHPGDEVIVQDPVYHPFWSLVSQAGCVTASNPLKLIDGRYEMDLEDLDRRFARRGNTRPRVRAIVLCSPHNPVGRVWTREELVRAGTIVIDHGAVVISDEVHCEVLYRGQRHTPFASITEEFAQNSIVCMAASKSFNLAGLAASTIIIPNERLRDQFTGARAGILPQPDVFGLVALETAYREGDEWLEQMLAYLEANLEFMLDYFQKRIPRIKVIKPEGTYLVWLDCRGLGLTNEDLQAFFRKKARVGLDDGYIFGPGGNGFQRINIACPRATLEEALGRIERAVNSL